MNVSRLDLNLLRMLVAVYEEGGLTAAAERLLMTQPGLSHALRRAREAFSDELFLRRPGGMEPTARMEALYPALSEALRRIEATLALGPAFDPRISTRRARIGVNDYGSIVVLPRLLRLLTEEAPGVTVRGRHAPNEAQAAALLERRVDLAVGVVAEALPPSLRARRLFVEDAVGVADPANAALGDPVTLAAYAGARHVIMSSDASDRSWVDDRLAAYGLTREVAHVAPHFAALFELVAGSDFVTTAPRRMAARLDAGRRLRVFALPFPPLAHELSLIWRRGDDEDPGHAWLRGAIMRVGAALAASG